jgi:MFS family permease
MIRETTSSEKPAESAWSPLQQPLFRNRLIASVLSNIGGWMQDTGATWLMTSLTRSPLLIALMQTAASLPVLLVGLPAGATADILDRRKLLIFWQTWMLAAAAVLSVLSFLGVIGPWMLLFLTLMLNIGAAMNNPAWQAIVPELVPRSELPQAISLNSAGYNLARAVGPAFGGLTMAFFVNAMNGGGTVFAINAASFICVIFVLYMWQRKPLHTSDLPAERMVGSMRAGVRYILHAPEIQRILIRAFLMTSCVAAMWSLLAVVARQDLQSGALGYGLLNGCIGIGAVTGAILLPRVRARFDSNSISIFSSIAFAFVLAVMAFAHEAIYIVPALLLGGFAWTSTTSTFNIAVQLSAPAWVQARLLGGYQMTFQAGMALGSALWGLVAERFGTSTALYAAAAGLLIGLPVAKRYRIPSGRIADLSSARGLNRSEPTVLIELRPEDGPVLILIEYEIEPDDEDRFLAALERLRPIRLRDGAVRWGLFHDAANPQRYVENFLVESWVEYLRQRERLTMNDTAVIEKVRSFQKNHKPPVVSRMIYTPVEATAKLRKP